MRAYASIRALVLDAAAGKLGPDLYIPAVLAAECEPTRKSEFLRVKSIYRRADTLYLARTVEQSLLLDDGQSVQLIPPGAAAKAPPIPLSKTELLEHVKNEHLIQRDVIKAFSAWKQGKKNSLSGIMTLGWAGS